MGLPFLPQIRLKTTFHSNNTDTNMLVVGVNC